MCNQNAEGALLLLTGVQIASRHLGNPKTIASFNGFEAVAVDISNRKVLCAHMCPCMHTYMYVYVCMYRDR